MSRVFLGLGSNLGDRRAHLEMATGRIAELLAPRPLRVSPVYETPALLPPDAEPGWDRAFLNVMVEGDCALVPAELLARLQTIERDLGRTAHACWAPREIDIDIVRWDGVSVAGEALTIPHPQWERRAFVLDPMKDLDPRPELLALARGHPQHAPVWMAILNVTPDSFSDGGALGTLDALDAQLGAVEECAGIVDVGAESTRPGARLLEWDEEWRRLEPVLRHLHARYAGRRLAPRVSVDTRHAEVARRALAAGAAMINDVSGLADPAMPDVLAASGCDYVLMHSLSIPPSAERTMPRDEPVMPALHRWFTEKLAVLAGAGIPPARTLIDPGIGFGKTSLQSLEILRKLDALTSLPCRLVVGHSRKSFLRAISDAPAPGRDLESIGIALQVIRRGADVLRVHDPLAHHRTFLAWNRLNDEHQHQHQHQLSASADADADASQFET